MANSYVSNSEKCISVEAILATFCDCRLWQLFWNAQARDIAGIYKKFADQ